MPWVNNFLCRKGSNGKIKKIQELLKTLTVPKRCMRRWIWGASNIVIYEQQTQIRPKFYRWQVWSLNFFHLQFVIGEICISHGENILFHSSQQFPCLVCLKPLNGLLELTWRPSRVPNLASFIALRFSGIKGLSGSYRLVRKFVG